MVGVDSDASFMTDMLTLVSIELTSSDNHPHSARLCFGQGTAGNDCRTL
jgi:hypothetical protein